MAPARKQKSALQRLTEEQSKTQRTDFDPEDIDHGQGSEDESSGSDHEGNGPREHYEESGQSRLRKPSKVALGPQYSGAPISRTVLDEGDQDNGSEDESEDDPFAPTAANGKSEDTGSAEEDLGMSGNGLADDDDDDDEALGEQSGDEGMESAPGLRSEDEQMEEEFENGEHTEDEAEEELDDDIEDGSEDEDHGLDGDLPRRPKSLSSDRAALRKLVNESQKAVVQSLSKAAQADIEKGQAVKKQRSAYDALLNTRIRLQRGLVSANTLSAPQTSNVTSPADREVIEAAEKAALTLFNSISDLRASLPSSAPQDSKGAKRLYSATIDTPTIDLQQHLQDLERASAPVRRGTLTRWAQKTAPASKLVSTNKLRAAPVQQSLTEMLDSQLMSPNVDRLISRTRLPRSCAPEQAKTSKSEDASIYDDADWYALLLRELVESKMTDSSAKDAAAGRAAENGSVVATAATVNALRREAKTHRANVDVKASKGRKLRYTVHEKIQNFMAPEDRTTWSEKQITELFGSLMGQKVRGGLGENVVDGEEANTDEDEQIQAGALRLFGGR